jgi:hypothetical protein
MMSARTFVSFWYALSASGLSRRLGAGAAPTVRPWSPHLCPRRCGTPFTSSWPKQARTAGKCCATPGPTCARLEANDPLRGHGRSRHARLGVPDDRRLPGAYGSRRGHHGMDDAMRRRRKPSKKTSSTCVPRRACASPAWSAVEPPRARWRGRSGKQPSPGRHPAKAGCLRRCSPTAKAPRLRPGGWRATYLAQAGRQRRTRHTMCLLRDYHVMDEECWAVTDRFDEQR